MKCHDFGQFLFNSSVFDDKQLSEIIVATKNVQPTFSTAAIFLRFVSISELSKIFIESKITGEENLIECFRSHSAEIQSKYDEVVQNFLSSQNLKEMKDSVEDPSVKLAQVLIDGAIDFDSFKKILEDYHKCEISPVEKFFGDWYRTMNLEKVFDYSPALDVAKDFHIFLSESLKTTIIFLSPPVRPYESLLGASVKIKGAMPIVVGVLTEKNSLHNLAVSYDKLVEEDADEDFDAVAEMLNVFTGNFTVKIASQLGIEEELFPPRFGQLAENICSLLGVMCSFGDFYLYIGEKEIFKDE